MDLGVLKPLVEKIHGCTFASLDALCEPKPGVMQRITGERVIIFRTNGKSGYEAKVRKHLEAAGKIPDGFVVGPLPWGERLGDLPIICNHGKYYLQTIQLAPGKVDYFLAFSNIPVDPKDFGIKESRPQLDLPPDAQVRMHTYKIENIQRITLMGETISTAEKVTGAITALKTTQPVQQQEDKV